MWLIGIATPIFISISFAVIGFLIKRWMDGVEAREKQDYFLIDKKLDMIDSKIKEICRNQAACQSMLPEKYVLRVSCDRDMAEVKGIIRHNSYYQGIQ